MGDGDAASGNGGKRCPKHPSEPPFTGFCSACLLDRLHATNLIGVAASPSQAHQHPPPLPLSLHQDLPPPAASTSTAAGRRTTLLHLFQLEDQGEQREPDTDAAASTSGAAAAADTDAQDPPPHLLQRKRSLRHSCSEWIACCDTSTAANHSSCLPSRQSLDAASSTATSAANDAAASATASASAASATSNGVAMVDRRTGSLRWNQLWSIKGFLARPAGHLLNRSFSESESSRARYAPRSGSGGAIARSSSSRSQGLIRLNGSRSVSSAGNGMDSSEISLPGDSVGHAPHVHHCRPRLKDRLHWLRRSHSVHYSTPTTIVDAGLTPFRSRSSGTRSMAHKSHSRFAAGFFAAQRHRHS